jgi:hypothetical protein
MPNKRNKVTFYGIIMIKCGVKNTIYTQRHQELAGKVPILETVYSK